VGEAGELLGGLDILVNNAGMTRKLAFADTPPEVLDFLFDLNIRGYFFCAQAAARRMARGGGGCILNIASVHAFGGIPGFSAYAATKGAIAAFTRQLAQELIPHRIRVNAIAPGHIEVERHRADPNYSSEAGAQRVPWGRVGRPEDIAHLAAFLVSDAAEFIIGQVVYVDGGLTSKLARTVETVSDTHTRRHDDGTLAQ
jgi:NAD(P)-dependent dehydrogenase (short-subunit alcohol dehydrogenase family)